MQTGTNRIPFQPYTWNELKRILEARLSLVLPDKAPSSKDVPLFHDVALQKIAKSVAGISGDARKALDVARRTLDRVTLRLAKESADSGDSAQAANAVAKLERGEIKCTIQDATQAYNDMTRQGPAAFVRRCSTMSKVLLLAVAQCVRRAGVPEVELDTVRFRLIASDNSAPRLTAPGSHAGSELAPRLSPADVAVFLFFGSSQARTYGPRGATPRSPAHHGRVATPRRLPARAVRRRRGRPVCRFARGRRAQNACPQNHVRGSLAPRYCLYQICFPFAISFLSSSRALDSSYIVVLHYLVHLRTCLSLPKATRGRAEGQDSSVRCV